MADGSQISDECTNHSHPGLSDLPAEIIEKILSEECLTPTDLLSVSLSCTHLRNICLSNELWKQKLKQRWPTMLLRYSLTDSYCWKEQYRHRHNFGSKLRTLVTQMSPKFYTQDEISKEGFSDFKYLISQHALAGECLVDELIAIVHDGRPDDNLTDKFYAVKAVRFVQHEHLKKKVSEFLEQPGEKQTLETGAVLIAQWCQPTENVYLNTICSQLDKIASEVRHLLESSSPHHPVLSSNINTEEVTSDRWTTDQSLVILENLNEVMFNRHHFQGNNECYYVDTNSYIDKVLMLETGIPITLCVVYASIARRLGVICEPVNVPSHFLLRWKQHPLSSSEQMYVYIDVFNKGKFYALGELPRALQIPIEIIKVATAWATQPKQVFERMIRNLVAIGRREDRIGDHLLCLRNALELSLLFTPEDSDVRQLLVRVNLHLNVNLLEVVDSLQTLRDVDEQQFDMIAYLLSAAQSKIEENDKEDNTVVVKKRGTKEKDVKFSVGLVMKHKRYNYTCVIYGWDVVCAASQEWIIQMGVNNLPKKDKQPFYNVLVDDGTNRYSAEENLAFPDQPCKVSHYDVGRYFKRFQSTHYVMNNEKLIEYPDDIQMTEELAAKQYPQL